MMTDALLLTVMCVLGLAMGSFGAITFWREWGNRDRMEQVLITVVAFITGALGGFVMPFFALGAVRMLLGA